MTNQYSLESVLQKYREWVTSLYGGKKPFLKHLLYSTRALFGGYSLYRCIDWAMVSRVVFVCHGNICRSPYAEHRYCLLGGCAISAGLEAKTGNQANFRAQTVARSRGVELASHRSLNISEVAFCPGDLFVTFEPAHAARLVTRIQDEHAIQVTLLGLWSPHPWSIYLHDPYGLSEKYFDHCFNRIDRSLPVLYSRLMAAKPLGQKIG